MNEDRRRHIVGQIEQRILDLKADQELVQGERSSRADLVRATRPAMIDMYEIMLDLARGLGDDDDGDELEPCGFEWWKSGDVHTHKCASEGDHNYHGCGTCIATRMVEDGE